MIEKDKKVLQAIILAAEAKLPWLYLFNNSIAMKAIANVLNSYQNLGADYTSIKIRCGYEFRDQFGFLLKETDLPTWFIYYAVFGQYLVELEHTDEFITLLKMLVNDSPIEDILKFWRRVHTAHDLRKD